MTKDHIRSNRLNRINSTVTADKLHYHKRYNMDMTYDADTQKKNFGMRLCELRIMRNVSAREMSISLGRGAGYINSIESGHTLPSIPMLFEICDYLGVSAKEFFAYTEPEMNKLFELRLTDVYRELGAGEKEIIRRIVELLERRG